MLLFEFAESMRPSSRSAPKVPSLPPYSPDFNSHRDRLRQTNSVPPRDASPHVRAGVRPHRGRTQSLYARRMRQLRPPLRLPSCYVLMDKNQKCLKYKRIQTPSGLGLVGRGCGGRLREVAHAARHHSDPAVPHDRRRDGQLARTGPVVAATSMMGLGSARMVRTKISTMEPSNWAFAQRSNSARASVALRAFL